MRGLAGSSYDGSNGGMSSRALQEKNERLNTLQKIIMK